MKKIEKLKPDSKNKVKPITFEQRFKDKKIHVGREGVYEILGVREQFFFGHGPASNSLPKNEKSDLEISPEAKRKLSFAEDSPFKLKIRNKKASLPYQSDRKQSEEGKNPISLPRISQSTSNLISDSVSIIQKDSQTEPTIQRKRAISQLSCLDMIKIDDEASFHWRKMISFERHNNANRRRLEYKINND